MWDYLAKDENGNITTVLEMKTTKRVEDWQDGIPEYYSLQAALYAYLLNIDDVVLVVSFLEDKDYQTPENFEPNITNTIVKEFKLSEKYPDFENTIKQAEEWWKTYVVPGISPEFDEIKDEEILKALRTNTVDPTSEFKEILEKAEQLKKEIDTHSKLIADKEKLYKKLTTLIKDKAISEMGENENKVEIQGDNYLWSVSKTTKLNTIYDDEKLLADGLFDKYTKCEETTSFRLTVK